MRLGWVLQEQQQQTKKTEISWSLLMVIELIDKLRRCFMEIQ